jgi:hypothetical protein
MEAGMEAGTAAIARGTPRVPVGGETPSVI